MYSKLSTEFVWELNIEFDMISDLLIQDIISGQNISLRILSLEKWLIKPVSWLAVYICGNGYIVTGQSEKAADRKSFLHVLSKILHGKLVLKLTLNPLETVCGSISVWTVFVFIDGSVFMHQAIGIYNVESIFIDTFCEIRILA